MPRRVVCITLLDASSPCVLISVHPALLCPNCWGRRLDDFSLCDHKGDCPYMQNALFEVGAEVMCPTPHWAMGWVCHTHEPFKSDGEMANGNFTVASDFEA